MTNRWNSPDLRAAYDAARNQAECPPDQATITYQIVRNDAVEYLSIHNEPSAART